MPSEAAWSLLPEELTLTDNAFGVSEPLIPQIETAVSTRPSFLGTNLIRPFRRDQKKDFVSASGEALVRAAVGQILATRASSDVSQGEIPWRTNFGSLLHLLRYDAVDEVFK